MLVASREDWSRFEGGVRKVLVGVGEAVFGRMFQWVYNTASEMVDIADWYLSKDGRDADFAALLAWQLGGWEDNDNNCDADTRRLRHVRPVCIEDVLSYEATLGMRLPADFRRALLEIGDIGGAMFRRDLLKPFVGKSPRFGWWPWRMSSMLGPVRVDDDGFPYRGQCASFIDAAVLHGSLYLGAGGGSDSSYVVLVMTGECRGQVWSVDTNSAGVLELRPDWMSANKQQSHLVRNWLTCAGLRGRRFQALPPRRVVPGTVAALKPKQQWRVRSRRVNVVLGDDEELAAVAVESALIVLLSFNVRTRCTWLRVGAVVPLCEFAAATTLPGDAVGVSVVPQPMACFMRFVPRVTGPARLVVVSAEGAAVAEVDTEAARRVAFLSAPGAVAVAASASVIAVAQKVVAERVVTLWDAVTYEKLASLKLPYLLLFIPDVMSFVNGVLHVVRPGGDGFCRAITKADGCVAVAPVDVPRVASCRVYGICQDANLVMVCVNLAGPVLVALDADDMHFVQEVVLGRRLAVDMDGADGGGIVVLDAAGFTVRWEEGGGGKKKNMCISCISCVLRAGV